MTRTDISLKDEEIAAVMPHFPVGQALFCRPAGGTANASAIVVTSGGQYVLRRRNPRYCHPDQLVYDHHVLAAVRAAGLPVPHLLKTRTGSRWLEHGGHTYELYDFMDGTVETHPDTAQIAAAGAMLARFHTATAQLTPPGRKSLGRLWDPDSAAGLLQPLLQRALNGNLGSLQDRSATDAADCIRRLLDVLLQIRQQLPDSAYWELPQTIIHADWHPANLKYSGSEIVGIFDFDWVDRQPRMVDVADGLIYFAGIRPQSHGPDDIWTLTATPQLDQQRMKAFMVAYADLQQPSDPELAAMPHLMAARWIYSRADAADRKVSKPDQLRFVLRDVESPLRWLQHHHNQLTDRQQWR